MKIAIEGCCHGELDKIYDTLQYLERRENIKVDLLLICGDFQAVRNRADLECMAVPKKYQQLNTFYKYYSGEKKAPVLTIFVGGNHEASNYLQELPYGGFVAPNIYYMGYAGVVRFKGLRIAGLSGIYKGRDYNTGHHERLPYSEDSKRSVYHVRNLEVFRLKQVQQPVDIMLSHDWPTNIADYGNKRHLLSKKRFLRDEVEAGTLGSPPGETLLYHLKPKYWFAAHLHVKFSALVKHDSPNDQEKLTKFLSLDKCLPKRDFLQVIDVPDPEPGTSQHLELDPEWLVILKTTNHLLSLKQSRVFMPGIGSNERYDFTVREADLQSVTEDLGGMFEIPRNFQCTAPVHNPQVPPGSPQLYVHPWTALLCEVLGITDPNSVFKGLEADSGQNKASWSPKSPVSPENDSVISDDDVPDSSMSFVSDSSFGNSTFASFTTHSSTGTNPTANVSQNPEEISIDTDSDSDGQSDPANLSQISEIGLIGSFPERACPSPVTSQSSQSDKVESSQSERLESSQSERLESSQSGPENSQSESEVSSREDGSTQGPQPKKFKRRNQSLYSSSDS